MADPITAGIAGITSLVSGSTPSWLPWVVGGAGVGAAAASMMGGSQQQQQTPTPAQEAPTPSAPAQTPQMKPAQRQPRQSFLAGAAQAQQTQQAQRAPGQGKTLVGQ